MVELTDADIVNVIRAERADERRQCVAEIERLRAALVSIGILNASGGHYDIEIDKVIREAAVAPQPHS